MTTAETAGGPEDDPTTGDAGTTAGDDDAYSGVFGAFPYAFRTSDSRLFKLYVVVGGGLAALLAALFGMGVVVQVSNSLGGTGGLFTFSRSFFLFVGLLVVAPIIAPVLVVARRHRRTGSDPRFDATMALAGVLFVLAVYAAGIASQPECFTLDGEQVCRDPPSGVLAPVVAALYATPPAASVVYPLVAGLVMFLAARRG